MAVGRVIWVVDGAGEGGGREEEGHGGAGWFAAARGFLRVTDSSVLSFSLSLSLSLSSPRLASLATILRDVHTSLLLPPSPPPSPAPDLLNFHPGAAGGRLVAGAARPLRSRGSR